MSTLFRRKRNHLIVTDEGVTNAGILSKTVEPLKNAQIDSAIFDAVQPNPTDLSVLEGLEVYRAEGCDVVIAVGGGSVMDAAKAIRILTTHEPPLENYYVDVGGIDRITSNLPVANMYTDDSGDRQRAFTRDQSSPIRRDAQLWDIESVQLAHPIIWHLSRYLIRN